MTAVYAREAGIADAVERWLAEQEWCGLVFRRGGIPGSAALPLRLAGTEHARAPDVAFTFAGSDAADRHGVPGSYPFDGELPVGAGNHGGLHPRELANVLIAGGSAFRTDWVSRVPAGLLDVAPTVADLLGLAGDGFDGRVLGEALADPEAPGEIGEELIETALGGRRRCLRLHRVGGTSYLGGDASIEAAASG
jgi:hypothetical protein